MPHSLRFLRFGLLLCVMLLASTDAFAQSRAVYNDRFFPAAVYRELDKGSKHGAHGRLLGRGYENRMYSRPEILAIAARKFEEQFQEQVRLHAQKLRRPLSLDRTYISGALVKGLYMPYYGDLKLVHEALGKPRLDEIPDHYNKSSEMYLIGYYAYWRNQKWNKTYGSLRDITRITEALYGTRRDAIHMVVNGQFARMTPEDIALRMYIRANVAHFHNEFRGLLPRKADLRYERAIEILRKANQPALIEKLKGQIYGYTEVRSGQTIEREGYLDRHCIYSFWELGSSNPNSEFNLSRDREITRNHYHAQLQELLNAYVAEQQRRAAEKEAQRQAALREQERQARLAEEQRIAEVEANRRQVIVSAQELLISLEPGVPLTANGQWNQQTQDALQVCLASIQVNDFEAGKWGGPLDGRYTSAFAEYLRSHQNITFRSLTVYLDLLVGEGIYQLPRAARLEQITR